jgi:hypothetical protein
VTATMRVPGCRSGSCARMVTGPAVMVASGGGQARLLARDHDPTSVTTMRRAKLPSGSMPSFLFSYDALHPDLGVERRWLEEHAGPLPDGSPGKTPDDITRVAEHMSERLEQAHAGWDRISGG